MKSDESLIFTPARLIDLTHSDHPKPTTSFRSHTSQPVKVGCDIGEQSHAPAIMTDVGFGASQLGV